ncbi:hypothetical protein KUV57_11890 [Epibacterium sp. DP7N7-1]|nr:hypothetical protein [Epibacterium sp. DP7N7-1]
MNFDYLNRLICLVTAIIVMMPVPVFSAGIGSYQCRHITPRFYGDDSMAYENLYQWISGYGHAFADMKATEFRQSEAMSLMIATMESCLEKPEETVQSVVLKLLSDAE